MTLKAIFLSFGANKAAGEAIDVGGDPRKQNEFAQKVKSLYGLG